MPIRIFRRSSEGRRKVSFRRGRPPAARGACGHVPGEGFGTSEHIRVSYATSVANWIAVWSACASFLRRFERRGPGSISAQIKLDPRPAEEVTFVCVEVLVENCCLALAALRSRSGRTAVRSNQSRPHPPAIRLHRSLAAREHRNHPPERRGHLSVSTASIPRD